MPQANLSCHRVFFDITLGGMHRPFDSSCYPGLWAWPRALVLRSTLSWAVFLPDADLEMSLKLLLAGRHVASTSAIHGLVSVAVAVASAPSISLSLCLPSLPMRKPACCCTLGSADHPGAVPGEPLGRITFELFKDVVPKTAENFRQFCTGESKNHVKRPQGFKGSKFHRIVSLASISLPPSTFREHT